jgi:hypothetical protein
MRSERRSNQFERVDGTLSSDVKRAPKLAFPVLVLPDPYQVLYLPQHTCQLRSTEYLVCGIAVMPLLPSMRRYTRITYSRAP